MLTRILDGFIKIFLYVTILFILLYIFGLIVVILGVH